MPENSSIIRTLQEKYNLTKIQLEFLKIIVVVKYRFLNSKRYKINT
jgi:hypothetical protein